MAQNLTSVTKTPTKAYGNSPDSLASSTPPDSFEAELAAASALAKTTAQSPAPASVSSPPVDDFESQLAQASSLAAPAPQTGPAEIPQDRPGAITVDENGASFIDQLKASLAANDTEKIAFLKKQFGQDNVKTTENGSIQYRKNPGEKFRKFNTTVINDFISSLIPSGRDAVKELGMIPGAVGGTIVGGPVGTVAGRVASVPSSNKLADWVAEQVGIPQDPTRNKTQEMAIEGVIEAALPAVARIGKGAVKQVTKRIPGTAANAEKIAKEFAKDAVSLAPENQAVLDSVNQLREAGFTAEILNSQINTQSKPLADAVARVKNTPQIQEAMTRVGQDAQKAIQDTFRAVVDTKVVGMAPQGRIGNVIKDTAKTIRKSEGEAIGAFKNQAIAKTKNARIPINQELGTAFNQIVESLELNPQTLGKVTQSDIEARLGKLGINDAGQMRSIINGLNSVYQQSNKGQGIRLSDMDQVVKTLGDLTDTAKRVGGPLSAAWGQLTGSARRFKNESIMSGLDDTGKKAFAATNARYGALLESVAHIEKMVDDDIGSHIIVDRLLSNSKTAVGDAKALKAILPAPTWEKLKGEWVEKQLTDFTDKNGKIKAGQLADYFRKDLGPEFKDILFDGDQKKFNLFKASLVYGQRVADTQLPVTGNIPQDQLEKTAKDVVTSIVGSPFLAARTLLNNVFGAGTAKKEQAAILTLLGNDGFQRYVANLPPKTRGIVSKKVDAMYDYAVTHNLMPAAKTAREVVSRTATQEVRTLPSRNNEEMIQDLGASQ